MMDQNNFLVTEDLYASGGKRFLNMIIDQLVYYALSFIIGVFLGLLELIGVTGILDYLETMGTIGDLVFGLAIILAYFILFEVLTQRTLGKFITKTMVIMEDGSKPTVQDILIRTFCRFIPFEAFSFLGSEARGWHDSISNTYVVDVARFEAKKKSQNELEQIGVAEEI